VLVLRFKRRDQEYKHPGNLHIGGREYPIGLITTTLALFLVAIANLFSKEIATIYGVAFTAVLFVVFTASERINLRKSAGAKKGLEEFNLDLQSEIGSASTRARPGCILVAVRDYNNLTPLQSVLRKTNMRRHDIVVVTVRLAEYELGGEQLFADYERELFTRVVTLAEKEGKGVDLLVVPGVNPFDALVQTAEKLKASRLVTGVSPKMDLNELARLIGLAWEKLPEPRHSFSLEVISEGRPSAFINLGPHPPRLWPEDIDLVHDLWLKLSTQLGSKLHHRDVVSVALRRLEREMNGYQLQEVVEELGREMHTDGPARTTAAAARNSGRNSTPRTDRSDKIGACQTAARK
jgi:hypothetical protein